MEGIKRPEVAALMSTYNGEKYLREQLDSILNQKDADVHIYIRDDGSTDATLDIIREYVAANPEKISLTAGENRGPGRSFMELLYQVPDTYDYYAFSDQDDVWLEDKLVSGIRFLQECGKELYAGNLMCVDAELNPIGPKDRTAPDVSPYGIMVRNEVYGCTMIFSNRLRSLLSDTRRPDEIILKQRNHDCWIAMVGAVSDMITYDPNCHILYRQHGSNVVGAGTYDSVWKRIRRRIRTGARKLLDKSKRNGMSRIAREILRLYPEEAARFPYLRTYAEAGRLSNKLKLTRSYAEYHKHGPKGPWEFLFYVWFNFM